MVQHSKTPGAYYCHGHRALFERQEAERNGENCPWCGDDVAEVLE